MEIASELVETYGNVIKELNSNKRWTLWVMESHKLMKRTVSIGCTKNRFNKRIFRIFLSLIYPNWLYFCVVLILIAIVITKLYSQLTPSPFWHLSSELHKKKHLHIHMYYSSVCQFYASLSFALRFTPLRFSLPLTDSVAAAESIYDTIYTHLCRVSFSLVEFIFASAIWNHLLN